MKIYTKEMLFQFYQDRKISSIKASKLLKLDEDLFITEYYRAGYKMPEPEGEERERQMQVFRDFYKLHAT